MLRTSLQLLLALLLFSQSAFAPSAPPPSSPRGLLWLISVCSRWVVSSSQNDETPGHSFELLTASEVSDRTRLLGIDLAQESKKVRFFWEKVYPRYRRDPAYDQLETSIREVTENFKVMVGPRNRHLVQGGVDYSDGKLDVWIAKLYHGDLFRRTGAGFTGLTEVARYGANLDGPDRDKFFVRTLSSLFDGMIENALANPKLNQVQLSVYDVRHPGLAKTLRDFGFEPRPIFIRTPLSERFLDWCQSSEGALQSRDFQRAHWEIVFDINRETQ